MVVSATVIFHKRGELKLHRNENAEKMERDRNVLFCGDKWDGLRL